MKKFLLCFFILLFTVASIFSITVTVEKVYDGNKTIGYYVSVLNDTDSVVQIKSVTISGTNINCLGTHYFSDVVPMGNVWYTTTIYIINPQYASSCYADVTWNILPSS